jgi:hypothetical protein
MDDRAQLSGYGPGEPREAWATPKAASVFFGTWVHKFEKDGGSHNQKIVPNGTWQELCVELRESLGWQGVKIDLYTLDHSVREVDKTFTQLGWHLDENRPNPSALDEPATVATAHESMKLLERYYLSYEPNELPKGTVLLTPVEEKAVQETKELEVKDLETLELPFTVHGTKRGGLPVLEEKHKHNYVTMVKNIEGDRKALLLELRNFIGAGGHVVANDAKAIEIQGRHQHEVEDFLVLRQCLVGVSASGAAAAAERVVNRSLDDGDNAGAGKKMKEGMKRGKDKKSKREAKQRKALGLDDPDKAGEEEDGGAPVDAEGGDGEEKDEDFGEKKKKKKKKKDKERDEDAGGDEEESEFGEKKKKKKKKDKEKDEDGEKKEKKEKKEKNYVDDLKAKIDDKGVEKATSWWIKTLNKSALDYKVSGAPQQTARETLTYTVVSPLPHLLLLSPSVGLSVGLPLGLPLSLPLRGVRVWRVLCAMQGALDFTFQACFTPAAMEKSEETVETYAPLFLPLLETPKGEVALIELAVKFVE